MVTLSSAETAVDAVAKTSMAAIANSNELAAGFDRSLSPFMVVR